MSWYKLAELAAYQRTSLRVVYWLGECHVIQSIHVMRNSAISPVDLFLFISCKYLNFVYSYVFDMIKTRHNARATSSTWFLMFPRIILPHIEIFSITTICLRENGIIGYCRLSGLLYIKSFVSSCFRRDVVWLPPLASHAHVCKPPQSKQDKFPNATLARSHPLCLPES